MFSTNPMKRIALLLATFALAASPLLQAQDTIPPFPKRPVPKAEGSSTRNVEVADFEKLRADPKWVLLDVRTPKEFAEGHMPGAKHIDFRGKNFLEEVAKLDKSKSYLVYCGAGTRSAKACTQMDGLKFKETVNLLGGYAAWVDAGNKPAK